MGWLGSRGGPRRTSLARKAQYCALAAKGLRHEPGFEARPVRGCWRVGGLICSTLAVAISKAAKKMGGALEKSSDLIKNQHFVPEPQPFTARNWGAKS